MQEQTKPKIDRFLGEMASLVARRERGALADLRRGFSKATAHRAWPYVAKWCDLMNERDRAVWMTVAAAFATLEKADPRAGNMGATFRKLAIGERRDKSEALRSFEGRFRRFLQCRSAEDVCERLPGIVRAARQRGVGVDLKQLWQDLYDWENAKVRWAKGYWSVNVEGPQI